MVLTDVFLLFFSGVVVASTVVYAALTWRLVGETRRMREVQTEPKVSVFLELNEHVGNVMDFVIHNIGQGPAYNIRFTFQGDPIYFGEDRLIDQLPVARNGLNYLGPNQTFRFVLGGLSERPLTTPFRIPGRLTLSPRVRLRNRDGIHPLSIFPSFLI